MIYFIKDKDKDKLKIGYSKDPERRFKEIQANSPIKLKLLGIMEGNYQTECSLHQLFDRFRSHAEWFDNLGLLKECGIALDMELRPINNVRDLLAAGTELQIRRKANRKARRGNGKLKHRINVLTK